MANPGKHAKRSTELWAQFDFDEIPTRSRSPRVVGLFIKGRRRYSRTRAPLTIPSAALYPARGSRR